MNEILPRSAYASFRDEAAGRSARHLRDRELRRRRINMFAAALLLAGAAFCGTMLMSPPTSHASLGMQTDVACLTAERSLEPWFKAELSRRAWASAARHDDFALLLTWFRSAQGQCASGLSDQALGNFTALARRITDIEERRQPAVD